MEKSVERKIDTRDESRIEGSILLDRIEIPASAGMTKGVKIKWKNRNGLFFPHNWKNLREKDCHDRYKYQEYDLASCWEEYRWNTKYRGEGKYDRPYLSLCESEFHESEVEMGRLISFERVFPSHDTTRDDIDEIDEVDTEDRYCRGDLASSDDRECCEEEGEHDRSRVTHDQFSRNICASQEECCWNNDREECEEEFRILSRSDRCVWDIELQCQSTEDDERDECESSSETRDPIRKIHTIEHKDIPENRDEEGNIIDRDPEICYHEFEMVIREIQNSSENIAHIGDLDTRESDNRSDDDLHAESEDRMNMESWFPDRLHIVEEWDNCDESCKCEYDMESMLEDLSEVENTIENRNECSECQDERDPSAIGNGFSPCFWLVQVGSIKKRTRTQNPWYPQKDHRWEYTGSDKDDNEFEGKGHSL